MTDTPWQAMDRDPEFKIFIQSRGWTAKEWNATEPWERGAERVEYNGGLEPTGIFRELPDAITQTLKEQGRAVGGVVKSVNRSVNRTLMIAAVGCVAVALVVYRNEVKKATEATARAVKKAIQ